VAGWWGDDPPYHHPVFVLTHHPQAPDHDARRDDLQLRQRGNRGRSRIEPSRPRMVDVRLGGGAATISNTYAPASWTRCTWRSSRSCSAA